MTRTILIILAALSMACSCKRKADLYVPDSTTAEMRQTARCVVECPMYGAVFARVTSNGCPYYDSCWECWCRVPSETDELPSEDCPTFDTDMGTVCKSIRRNSGERLIGASEPRRIW